MSVYAIGDVQGCYDPLMRLLERLRFDERRDELWFAGDLVNRGPDSLKTLRFVHALGERSTVVLGNHDLHLLACFYGTASRPRAKDTISDILGAPDCEELMQWLKAQPLLKHDAKRNVAMVHAGIPAFWSIEKALELAKEVSTVLRGESYQTYFDAMYGNQPDKWEDQLAGLARLRVITNYFTRMRFIGSEGELDFAAKEDLSSAPPGFVPWFTEPRSDNLQIVFGHWAALNGATGNAQFIGMDTGCVWGGALSAIDLDTRELCSVACDTQRRPA